eukprot:9574213-Heterocapsa_arctica.AAC.1
MQGEGPRRSHCMNWRGGRHARRLRTSSSHTSEIWAAIKCGRRERSSGAGWRTHGPHAVIGKPGKGSR